jgi:hypothetical protein
MTAERDGLFLESEEKSPIGEEKDKGDGNAVGRNHPCLLL